MRMPETFVIKFGVLVLFTGHQIVLGLEDVCEQIRLAGSIKFPCAICGFERRDVGTPKLHFQ